MGSFIVRRFGQAVITLLAMTVIVFLLARASGDPADTLLPAEATQEHRARMMELWGLDQPVHVQYGRFLMNAMRGDFGLALMNPGRDVLELVMERVGPTVELAAIAMLWAVVLALVIGVVSAVRKDSLLDTGGKIIAILGQSMPHFWIGIILMWVFAVRLGWLPTSGYGTWRHFVMPAIVVGWFQVSALMRLLRSDTAFGTRPSRRSRTPESCSATSSWGPSPRRSCSTGPASARSSTGRSSRETSPSSRRSRSCSAS